MGRTFLERSIASSLKRRIELAEKGKKRIYDYLQKLKNQWLKKEISYSDYLETVEKRRDGKNIQGWLDYYDNYIENCSKKLERQEKGIFWGKFTTAFGFALIILLLGFSGFYVAPTIISFIIKEEAKTYTQALNLEFNKNGEYEWQPEHQGTLNSVKISGVLDGEEIKVYLDDLLILESSNLKNKKKQATITGSAISRLFSQITGKASEDGGGEASSTSSSSQESQSSQQSAQESPQSTPQTSQEAQPSQSQQEEAPQTQTSPSQEVSPQTDKKDEKKSEEPSQLPEEKTKEEKQPEESQPSRSEEQEEPRRTSPSQEAPPQTENKTTEQLPEKKEENETITIPETPENITIPQNQTLNETAAINETIEAPGKPEEKPKKQKPEENATTEIDFFDICEETCDLRKLELNKSPYKIRVEIKNARLKIENIKYEIREEIEAIENATNVTIKNISEMKLIKEISDIRIDKSSKHSLNLSEYFENAESYSALVSENISMSIGRDAVTITPDAGFTGTRASKIIARNETQSIESNEFEIIVSEVTSIRNATGLALIKSIPDITLAKDKNFILNLSEYFENATSYSAFIPENISIVIEKDNALITPGINFTGTRVSKIIAQNLNDNLTIESNEFNIVVSEKNISIFTLRSNIKLGENVKWKKRVLKPIEENITLQLPVEAENITVTKISDENITTEMIEVSRTSLTGQVSLEIRTKKEKKGFFDRIKAVFTGRVIEDITEKTTITTTIDAKEVVLEENATQIEVDYETPSPQAFEQNLTNGKRIVISGPDALGYENITAFTYLSRETSSDKIRLYHLAAQGRQLVETINYDFNNNSLIDYVEWQVPHLSNETYELIYISRAEHLDENRSFISDISDYVIVKDGNYTAIPQEHFIRATFEKALDKTRDIAIYSRATGNAEIEVYAENSSKLITTFTGISEEGWYTIDLSNLGEGENYTTFDLKIIGEGGVEIDYIFDADAILPYGYHLSPKNFSTNNSLTVKFQINETDETQLANATLFIWNSSGVLIHNNWTNMSSLYNQTNWSYTFSYDGLFNWSAMIFDTTGNWNWTDGQSSARNWTLNQTGRFPLINITYPLNTTYIVNVSELNYTIYDAIGYNGCWYTLNNGTTNTSITCGNNATSRTSLEGANVWTVYVNDSSGNTNWTNVTFYKDTFAPTLAIIFPANSSNFTYKALTVNYSVSDTVLQACWYTNNSGVSNSSLTCGNNITATWQEGINNVTVYANDSLGNQNRSDVKFTIDSMSPNIAIVYPLNTTYDFAVNLSNYTVSDIALQACWFSNDSGTTNLSIACGTNFTGLNSTVGSNTWIMWANDTVGNQNKSNITFTVASAVNTAPNVTLVTPIANQVPIELGVRNVTFWVNVYDSDGASQVNSSSVEANFTMNEQVRQNLSCSRTNDIDANTVNYTCNIGMQYWDGNGTWAITVRANDSSGAFSALNNTNTFNYTQLQAIVIAPPSLTWSTLSQGATNQTPSNNPFLVNNTGNANATTGLRITGANLHGEDNSDFFIGSGNFSISNNTGGTPFLDCNGTALQNGTEVTIANSVLQPGNLSAGGGTGQEQLYFCLNKVPQISSQTYSTLKAGSWTIRIALVAISFRKRKKNKFYKELEELLNEAGRELGERKTIEIAIEKLQEKFKISGEEITKIAAEKEINIPVAIFSRKLGALEIVVKYMKENLGKSYSEIARMLKRDDRTIWSAYKKAIKKKAGKLYAEKGIQIPVSILRDRALTVLESIIIHLREKKMRYNEIAGLLDRDQRNIWTIYSRAVKKLNKKV